LHGGLEPGTSELATEAAARADASLYAVSQPDHLNLHVPAHHIDPAGAPRLAEFLEHVDIVLSIHGYWRDDLRTTLLLGGADRAMAQQLAAALRTALPEYEIVDDLELIPSGLRGVNPLNPVNMTRGGGVQLELPHPVRAIGPYGYGYAAQVYRPHAEALTAALAAFAARAS
jgi:phage replication-related protein YjqB (UPF0714/DUF867 family)